MLSLLFRPISICFRGPCLFLVSYHDGRVVRTWYGNGKIEIEAVFTLLGVRIPHIGTRKALKHHVNDLNTGIRPMVCFLNARPPFDTVYILGQYALLASVVYFSDPV